MRGSLWPDDFPLHVLTPFIESTSHALFDPEGLAQAVPEKVDAEHGEDDGQSGQGRHPPGNGHVQLAVVEHSSPGGCRWLDPDPDVTQ